MTSPPPAFVFDLKPFQDSDGEPMAFEISLRRKYDESNIEDNINLGMKISREGLLRFVHSEGIEPNEWKSMCVATMSAVESAKEFAGADWLLDGDRGPYFIVLTPRLASDICDKNLRVDFEIADCDRVIQTGMLDWQNGLYIWDSAQDIPLHRIPDIFTAINKAMHQIRPTLVDHQCLYWD